MQSHRDTPSIRLSSKRTASSIAVMIVFGFNDIRGRFNLTWQGFTVRWYRDLLAFQDLTAALRNSLIIATISTVVATTLGTMIALALTRYRFRGRAGTNLGIFLPMATPEVVLGARGNVPEHDLFRKAAAVERLHAAHEPLLRMAVAVGFRQVHRDAERAPARNDRHLIDRIVIRDAHADDRVARLMVGRELALLVAHDHRAPLGAHHDLVLGLLEVELVDQALVRARREQRGERVELTEARVGRARRQDLVRGEADLAAVSALLEPRQSVAVGVEARDHIISAVAVHVDQHRLGTDRQRRDRKSATC